MNNKPLKKWKDQWQITHHLVAEIKDGETDIVISKWWNKNRKAWVYAAETKYMRDWTLKQIESYKMRDKNKP